MRRTSSDHVQQFIVAIAEKKHNKKGPGTAMLVKEIKQGFSRFYDRRHHRCQANGLGLIQLHTVHLFHGVSSFKRNLLTIRDFPFIRKSVDL